FAAAADMKGRRFSAATAANSAYPPAAASAIPSRSVAANQYYPCGRDFDRTAPGETMISTNQFKNGTHIDVDGTVFKIVEFQHVKPGKGGAFVRTKLRRAADGAVIDKTFRAGEKFRQVNTETRKMQFLYSDGADAHFMDTQSYE